MQLLPTTAALIRLVRSCASAHPDIRALKRNYEQSILRIVDAANKGEDFSSETFRVLKNNEIKQFGEYRTQRLVLEAWDKMFE